MASLIGRMLCTPIYQESFYYSSLSASITFHGERLSTLYFDITKVTRFFTKATFLLISLYFKNIKLFNLDKIKNSKLFNWGKKKQNPIVEQK